MEYSLWNIERKIREAEIIKFVLRFESISRLKFCGQILQDGQLMQGDELLAANLQCMCIGLEHIRRKVNKSAPDY